MLDPLSTHSPAAQRRHVQALRDTLDALPPDLPDGIVNDIVDLTLELRSFIERSQPGAKATVFYHARDRE